MAEKPCPRLMSGSIEPYPTYTQGLLKACAKTLVTELCQFLHKPWAKLTTHGATLFIKNPFKKIRKPNHPPYFHFLCHHTLNPQLETPPPLIPNSNEAKETSADEKQPLALHSPPHYQASNPCSSASSHSSSLNLKQSPPCTTNPLSSKSKTRSPIIDIPYSSPTLNNQVFTSSALTIITAEIEEPFIWPPNRARVRQGQSYHKPT